MTLQQAKNVHICQHRGGMTFAPYYVPMGFPIHHGNRGGNDFVLGVMSPGVAAGCNVFWSISTCADRWANTDPCLQRTTEYLTLIDFYQFKLHAARARITLERIRIIYKKKLQAIYLMLYKRWYKTAKIKKVSARTNVRGSSQKFPASTC